MTVCTRFAPSPTGVLHIGSARTALFSWLYARKHNGKFILRIEDTDLERSTPESIEAIYDGMRWLGLEHDGEVAHQTHRFERYQEVINQLLEHGQAYYCNCSKDRLEALRAEQMANKQKPRYDGHCRDMNLSPETPDCVVRFKTPLSGEVEVHDQVHGVIRIANAELDDLVLARTDGVPTYNLTVVVDDWDMGITHVIRGDDHINNTPRQINILQALGADIPMYAHIPMILGPDGKRLSKRHGATGVMQYRDEGYLPEAMLNYLVRLGWSYGDQEIFSCEELVDLFDLSAVNRSASAINADKLLWLNQHYIKTLPLARLAEALMWHLQQVDGLDLNFGPSLEDVVELQRDRAKTLVEMAEKSVIFFREVTAYEQKAQKHLKAEVADALTAVATGLEALPEWEAEPINKVVIDTAEAFSLKLGKLAQPIRVAVTGGTVSPSIDGTLQLIGRKRVVARINAAVEWIASSITRTEQSGKRA